MVLDIFGTYKGPSFRAPHFYTPSNKPPIDYLATIGAALRQENFAISGLNRFSQWLVNTTHPEEKEYDAWRDIRGTRYEDHALLFASSRSKADTLAIMAAIDREIADKKLLHDAGAFGLISSLIAGTIDPINLIPLGGALTKISRIPSIFKRVPLGFAAGIGTGAVGAAAQELGLYATQLTRTPEEVQMGISGGALLGGLLGGAASFLHVPIDVAGNRVLMDWEGRPLWHVKTDIVRKTGMYSRDEFRADLIHEWALPAEQVDAALAAFEATAVRRWAELNNKTIDDWYAEHLGQAVAYSESELQAQIKLGKRSNRLVSQMNIEPDELARKILSQSEGELFRGASVFDFRNDGKAILVALRGAADITTLLHELAHVQRKTLLPSEIKVLEHFLGVKDGKWTRAAEEKYVELVEQRIREKKWAEGAPDVVKPVLEKFVQWIMDVWTRLRETPLAEEIHPQVKRIIEKYWVPYKESLPVPPPSKSPSKIRALPKTLREWIAINKGKKPIAAFKGTIPADFMKTYRTKEHIDKKAIYKFQKDYGLPPGFFTGLNTRDAINFESLFEQFNKDYPHVFGVRQRDVSIHVIDDIEAKQKFFEMIIDKNRWDDILDPDVAVKQETLKSSRGEQLDETFDYEAYVQVKYHLENYFPEIYAEIQEKKISITEWYKSLTKEQEDEFFREIDKRRFGISQVLQKDVTARLKEEWSVETVEALEEKLRREGSDEERIAIILENYLEDTPATPARELFTEEGELIPFQKLPREAEYAQEQLRKLFDAVEKRGTDVLFQKLSSDSTVDSLDIQPIPFIPDFALKFMAKISPSTRLFTSRYSKAGARLAEQLINVSFYLGRHWNGESTQAPPVEILAKKKIGSYFSEASKSVNDAFVKYRARIAGEKIPDRATIGKYVGLRTKDFIQQKILREQGIIDMDSFKRLVFDAWGGKKIDIPEVMEAARVRRELMDRLGKELSDAGLLTPELKELLNQGVGHRPRIYNIWAIEKYNRHFREIVKTQAEAAGLKVPGTGDLDEILDDIVRTHTGFLWFETRVDINNLDNLKGEQAKFLHKRFFNFSDEHLLNVEIKDKDGNVVDVVDFIQTDPDRVLLTYLNAVVPDLELKKRFGSIDLIKQFKEISKDYNDKIDAAEGPTDDITYERKAVLRDLLALRDRLRGVDRIVGDPRDPIRRGYNAIQRLNGTLYLGNVLLSSLADPGRAVMRYGLQPFQKALSSALANPELWQQFKGWERSIGAAVDVLTTPNSRWLEFADLTHPYQGKNMVERGIGFLSDQFGLMTGLDIWTSQWKALTGLITSHWILDAALILQKELDEGKITLAENGAIDVTGGMSILGQKRIQNLAQMNLNARELVEIAREFKKYGDSENPDLWLPRTNEWQNKAIRDKFESAIIQEMENTIVTPDIGDRPLIAGETGALGPLGPLMTQFWSFTFASMQKVIMSGLQQRDKAVLQGVLAMTFLGGVSYAAKQLARGETPTTDPDEFLLEAIDNAGLLGIFSNINGFIEQLSKGNFGLHPLVGEGIMSRYQYREWPDILFGASASTLKNLTRVASVPFSWDMGEREINSAFNLIPYSRLWYWRWIFEHLRENSVDMLTPTGTE